MPENAQTTKNLYRILELNAKINSTLDLEELLGILMNTAAEVMDTHAASLMLLDPTGQELIFKVALGCKANQLKESFRVKVGEGIAGTVAATRKALLVNDTQKDPRFAKRFDASTGFKTEAILCVPMHAKGKIIGILEAINPRNRKEFNQEDLTVFQIFADQAAIAVENARLHTETLQQEKTKQELKIAHEIQQNFLPDLTENKFCFDIAAQNIPARQVGGDFYDVVPIEEGRVSVMIGDVSGKGVPAALYMVRAISEYRFLAPICKTPKELVEKLNKILSKNAPFGMFVTLLCMTIDRKTQSLEYVSAGHHPILLRKKNGNILELKNTGGLPVGLAEDSLYEQDSHKLEAGDSFLTYTDGIIEARNLKGEEYGLQKLKDSFCRGKLKAAENTPAILEKVIKYSEGMAAHDDATVLLVQVP